jgi:glucose-6-phosphate 1-dehydrogenase
MSEQGFKVDCRGMAHSTPPDPCVVVIFGVAGDLGRTTLVPSLYALACQKLLPEPCAILRGHDRLQLHRGVSFLSVHHAPCS